MPHNARGRSTMRVTDDRFRRRSLDRAHPPDPRGRRGRLRRGRRRARDEHWATRLFDRDTTLWSSNERVQAAIADRLGWLDSPGPFHRPDRRARGLRRRDPRRRLHDRDRRRDGRQQPRPRRSSREVFGAIEDWLDAPRPRHDRPGGRGRDRRRPRPPRDPLDRRQRSPARRPSRSRSSPTSGPRGEHALRTHGAKRFEHAGELVVAITDPGTSVEAIPHHDDFREVFLNPPDIGGRYPRSTLRRARAGEPDRASTSTRSSSRLGRWSRRAASDDPETNPGVSLGLAIGTLAKNGRDKLTFVADPAIASFGSWLEQLIAESTGKHGTGIVPIDREPLGDDRRPTATTASSSGWRSRHSDGEQPDAAARHARRRRRRLPGHPVIRIDIADPIDLGAEMFRWEVATAIAGAVLGIDPFDQPNVEEAKELTRKVLASASYGEQSAAPSAADGRRCGRRPHPPRRRADAPDATATRTVVGELARHLARRRPNAYLALQAFIAPSAAASASIDRIRALLRDATHCATTAGYGPRFLHSTGQLHKGGDADRLVPPAHGGPPRGSADPRLAVHVRPADRRPGRGRLRGDRVPRPADPPRPSRRPGARPGRAGSGPPRGARPGLSGHDPRTRRPPPARHDREAHRNADRVRRSRADGRQHGPPPPPGRPRGRRLQPDAGEDEGDRGRGRDRRLLDRGAGREAREAAGRLDHGPGRRRDRGPDRRADGAPRARRHDHRRREHELPRRPAPPRRARRRRASTTSTPGRPAGSGASRSATA